MKSAFLSLNLKDALKGFVLAIITTLLGAAYQAIQTGSLAFTWTFWQPIVYSAVGAGLAYLIKNFLTNSDDKLLKADK